MTPTPLWAGSGLRICGYGHYHPRSLVENSPQEELATGSVDAAIIGKVDVRRRHVAADDETVVYMAVQAAQQALEDAGLTPDQVDLLVFSNATDRFLVPEDGPHVAALLGADNCFAFDVSGACTGFVHGVHTAAAYMQSQPDWTTALVVSSERFSRRVRPGSKGELIVGDAAGAIVMTRGEPSTTEGLRDTAMFSDGHRRDLTGFWMPNGWLRSQPELVENAVASHHEVVGCLLERGGISIDEVDWFVPHPGTGKVQGNVRDALEVPPERFTTNFLDRGNTGSASIPMQLSEMWHSGRLNKGDLVLAVAVGAGWYYGGVLYRA